MVRLFPVLVATFALSGCCGNGGAQKGTDGVEYVGDLFSPNQEGPIWRLDVRYSVASAAGDEGELVESKGRSKMSCSVVKTMELGPRKLSRVKCEGPAAKSDSFGLQGTGLVEGWHMLAPSGLYLALPEMPATSDKAKEAEKTAPWLPLPPQHKSRKTVEEQEPDFTCEVTSKLRKTSPASGSIAAWCVEERCSGPHDTARTWCFDKRDGLVEVTAQEHGGASVEVTLVPDR